MYQRGKFRHENGTFPLQVESSLFRFQLFYFLHLVTRSRSPPEELTFGILQGVFRLPGGPRVFKAAKSDSPLTKAFNKRASRPGKGGGGGGIYSRDSSSCFDVNDEARILCGFLGNERMERMEGAAAAAARYRLRRAISSPRAEIGRPIIAVEWSKSANYGEKIE